MRVKYYLQKIWPSKLRRNRQKDDAGRQSLREFVYLDEVSLTSLLSSQKGELTAEILQAVNQAGLAEIAGSMSANAGVASSKLSSRYQTSNSQSTQTTRKANLQSLFKGFRKEADNHLLMCPGQLRAVDSRENLEDDGQKQKTRLPADSLTRGSLIEMEVELEADPVYKLSTMVSELFAMSDDYPEMLSIVNASLPPEAKMVDKVLQRMLAGLVPIRARAVNLVVADVDGKSCIIRTETATSLGLMSQPLYVVGVTEHFGVLERHPARSIFRWAFQDDGSSRS